MADPAAPLLPSHAGRRRVGVGSLVVIGFFWVSGGIYGNEELVSAAPPALVCGMTLLTAVGFALPNALMTAELAAAFPVDAGQVVWVHAVAGGVVGAQNAWWIWLTNALDAAVYPQLAAHYIAATFGSQAGLQQVVCFGTVAAVAIMNLLGLGCVTASQSACFVLSLLPCLAFIAIGLPRVDPAAVVATGGVPTDWALLLSWALWLYSGFSSLGSMAGEVERPNRTYPIVVGVLLPLISALNVLPFAIALSLDPVAAHYQAGYFGTLAGRLSGRWLELTFACGANISMLGLYMLPHMATLTHTCLRWQTLTPLSAGTTRRSSRRSARCSASTECATRLGQRGRLWRPSTPRRTSCPP